MSRTIDNNKDSDVPEREATKSGDSESAFRRWSRRKHEARVTSRPDVGSTDPTPVSGVERHDPTPERVLTDADMPPLDELNEKSDFSPFMSPGVSDALRQAALRRLFRTPQMNVLCELEGEFYDTLGLTPLGDIVTYDMRAALKRELEEAKSKAKERMRDELTDTEDPELADRESEAKPEPPGQGEPDPQDIAARGNENPQDDRGAT
jgi:hypothetical protein